ncbi:MAG: MFS transporter [Planctomycetota bacterium]
MLRFLRPTDGVDEAQTRRGLRALMGDGVCSQTMGVLTGGAFLVALALQLGASNATIGLLAAIGPATQVLQIPAVFVVDRLRRRKLLVVGCSVVGRTGLLSLAFVPWVLPEEVRVPALLGVLGVYFGLGSVAGCAWNSWMRDFVPGDVMGRFFGRRLAVSTAIGAGLTLLAGLYVDAMERRFGMELVALTSVLVAGGVAGLVAVAVQSRIPEPRMRPAEGERGLLTVLGEPFRDKGFRPLLVFLGSWGFAVNLALPFTTVYMLERLGLPLAWVVVLSVFSQLVNVVFFRVWGRLADRFTNKSCLSVAGPMLILTLALWPLTSNPGRYALTVPLLFLIHGLSGVATAGVNLCAGNIALRAAPAGRATAYLAINALVTGLAATAAPVFAGLAADWFTDKNLSLLFDWSTDGTSHPLRAVDVRGLDFLFGLAVVLGFYAWHRLLAVREQGEVEERVVMNELMLEMRRIVRGVSSVAGLRQLTYFPYAVLTGRRRDGEGGGGGEHKEDERRVEPGG